MPNTADSVNTAEDRFFKFPKLFNIPDKSSEEVEYKRPHYYPVYTITPRPLFLNVNLPKLPSFKKPKLPLPAKKVPLIVVPIIKPGKPLKQKKPNIQLITTTPATTTYSYGYEPMLNYAPYKPTYNNAQSQQQYGANAGAAPSMPNPAQLLSALTSVLGSLPGAGLLGAALPGAAPPSFNFQAPPMQPASGAALPGAASSSFSFQAPPMQQASYTPAPYTPAPYTPAPYTPAPYTPAPPMQPAPFAPAPPMQPAPSMQPAPPMALPQNPFSAPMGSVGGYRSQSEDFMVDPANGFYNF